MMDYFPYSFRCFIPECSQKFRKAPPHTSNLSSVIHSELFNEISTTVEPASVRRSSQRSVATLAGLTDNARLLKRLTKILGLCGF